MSTLRSIFHPAEELIRYCACPGVSEALSIDVAGHAGRLYQMLAVDFLKKRGLLDCYSWKANRDEHAGGYSAAWHPALAKLLAHAASPQTLEDDPALEVSVVATLSMSPTVTRLLRLNQGQRMLIGEYCLPPFSSGAVQLVPFKDGLRIEAHPSNCSCEFDFTTEEKGEPWNKFTRPRLKGLQTLPFLFGRDLTDDPNGLYAAQDSFEVENLEALHEAFCIIDQYGEAYADWIRFVVGHIRPIVSPSGGMISGSSRNRLGEIELSVNVEPIKIAEMIIHEASHQYFYLLEMACDLVTDRTVEHRNPVLGRNRPLDKLLLAFHAFVNVENFLAGCLQRGLPCDGKLEQYYRNLTLETDEMFMPFRRSSYLTREGELFRAALRDCRSLVKRRML